MTRRKPIRIKLSIGGAGSDLSLSQYSRSAKNVIGDCEFFVNERIDEADFWFVLEEPNAADMSCRVPPERVFFLSAETCWPPSYYEDSASRLEYLKQFHQVFTCHGVYLPNVTYTLPFLPWMINSNHGPSVFSSHRRSLDYFRGLESVDKTRSLSVFCSTQSLTSSHRMRLKFVEQIKEHFGDRVEWFGNGVKPVVEKWEGIAPFKYTIVLENQSSPNIITEKILDAYLGLAFPIYWGAPNIGDFFPAQSFLPLDIKDLRGSVLLIEDLLARDPYESLHPTLLEAKNLVVNELNFLNRILRIVDQYTVLPPESRDLIRLRAKDRSEVPSRIMPKIMRRAGNLSSRIADLLGSKTGQHHAWEW